MPSIWQIKKKGRKFQTCGKWWLAFSWTLLVRCARRFFWYSCCCCFAAFLCSAFSIFCPMAACTSSLIDRSLAHKAPYKNVRKVYKIFKPRLYDFLSTGTNIVKVWLSLCLIGCVRFARYCGKTYNRHLFSYGGLTVKWSYNDIIFLIVTACYIMNINFENHENPAFWLLT